MKEIVVAYDGTEESRRAVGRAADVAEAFSSQLVVVSVTRPSAKGTNPELESPPANTLVAPGATVPVALAPGGVPSAADAEAEEAPGAADLAERQLEQARSLVAGRSVRAEVVSRVGDAAEGVLEVARDRGSDLIVVGSRDHGFFERFFSKPVDEAVARQAETDVLLVH